MSQHVVTESAAGVTAIRMNRPDKKNALTVEMYEVMARAVAEAEKDPAVKVIRFEAAGETFSAGNDLADFMQRPPTGPDSPVFAFLTAIATAKKPLVAAVDGLGVGIGLTMLLHCDLVYASDRARFRTPFVDLGLVPEAGSSLILPRLIGHPRAAELILLGETIDAKTALERGIVNAVVAPGELAARAAAACAKLAAKPPTALKISKQLLKETAHATVTERIAHEAGHFGRQLASAEVKEAISAFFEKRAPDFSKIS